ncbi:MAG: Kazal-type serine protease inhibitor family protein [Bacteroidetes bacterium]|nr:Kazal-type serine protease inhibitor family protein [Bacteroidota bacterium]
MKRVWSILPVAIFFLALTACGEGTRDCPDRTLYSDVNCPKDTSWVCGCDDSTYLNECTANKKGRWVQYEGKCQ